MNIPQKPLVYVIIGIILLAISAPYWTAASDETDPEAADTSRNWATGLTAFGAFFFLLAAGVHFKVPKQLFGDGTPGDDKPFGDIGILPGVLDAPRGEWAQTPDSI